MAYGATFSMRWEEFWFRPNLTLPTMDGEVIARMLRFRVGRAPRSRVPPRKELYITLPVSALMRVKLVTAVAASAGEAHRAPRSAATASREANGLSPHEGITPPCGLDRHPGGHPWPRGLSRDRPPRLPESVSGPCAVAVPDS